MAVKKTMRQQTCSICHPDICRRRVSTISGRRPGRHCPTSLTPITSGRVIGIGLRKELKIPMDGLIVLVAAAIKRSHKRVDYLVTE
jgi:hypothetical protein